MTEVMSGYPATRTEYDPDQTEALIPVPAEESPAEESSAEESSAEESLDSVEPVAPSVSDGQPGLRGVVGEAGQRVGAFASEAGEKVGALANQVADRLRNNAELAAERGTTTIADEVVEKIASFAAREVEGVYDLGGDVSRVFAAVKERVGLGESSDKSDRGVTVRLKGASATIKIVIVIEYGYVVYSVTDKVRSKVISAVESLLGLEVTAVDLVVDDVHMDESKLAATAAKSALAA